MIGEPTDEDLWKLILKLEDEMWAAGIPPKGRHFELPIRAMGELGYASFVTVGTGEPPILTRIRAMQGTLYRRRDVAVGGVHGGAYMFRGIATNVYIPIIYGTVSIDPYALSDLSGKQIQWLRLSPEQDRAYVENFCNLFDFAGCLSPMSGYRAVPEGSRSLLGLSAFQTQSAAATLCASFDERGAVQSALMAAELSLKAALAGAGASEADRRALGHNFENLVQAVGNAYRDFDLKEAMKLVSNWPALVPNRYAEEQPDRGQTGEIVVASQAIGGLVARALSGGDLWSRFATQFRKDG